MKNYAAIDTNILIDIVIDRDTSDNSISRLTKVMSEYEAIFVPFHAIIEFIYVLQNIHKTDPVEKLSKKDIIDKVNAILSTPQFVVENRKNLETALPLYGTYKMGDAVIAATLINNGIKAILSNDKHFAKIENIKQI
jgi:predicted nucleic acid-binding protein